METITVEVGQVVALSSGAVQESLRTVEFEGEGLAQRNEYGYSARSGGLTDTRGIKETLYRADDGRFVVYVEEWSRWQGEPNTSALFVVGEGDLGVGGEFEALGREAGMGRALTLDEAL